MSVSLELLLNESIDKLKQSSSSPNLDAEVIFCHTLKIDKIDLILRSDEIISPKIISKIRGLINRRKNGEPIAYILKSKEFYGLPFLVSPAVLIPRPESEYLIDEAIKIVSSGQYSVSYIRNNIDSPDTQYPILDTKYSVLDIGTGSGCLIISLVNKLIESQFSVLSSQFCAADISPAALSIARHNAHRLLGVIPGLTRNPITTSAASKIKFIHSDLFSNRLLHKKFDLIVANLPYVPVCHSDPAKVEEESSTNIGQFSDKLRDPSSADWRTQDDYFSIKFEPRSAIFANDNGAAIIKKFLDQSVNYLAPNGTILIELDPRNAKEIKKYASSVFSPPFQGGIRCGLCKQIELKKDLAGLDRYLIIKTK